MNYFDLFGFIGVFILVFVSTISYFHIEYRDKHSFFYLTLLGSILLIPNDLYHKSYPSFAIGVFFILSSFFSLFNKNVLSHRTFLILIYLFSFFWFYECYLLYQNSKNFDIKFTLDFLAILSVGFSVILFGLFTSRKITVLENVIYSILATIIIMPSLYYSDSNYAQILLKVYTIIVGFIAIIKVKYFTNSKNNV